MTVKNSKISSNKEVLVDDISNEEKTTSEDTAIDQDKLAALKLKMAKKNEGEVVVEVKKRSIKIGVIGTGQMGSRLAQTFFNRGYEAVAINTAQQDLEHIKIPEANKLFMDFSLGGASKDKSIGGAAAEAYKDQISDLIYKKLSDTQVFIVTTSCGGGSGAGSLPTIIDILQTTERPIVVIACLPMTNEDAQTKANSLETLSELAKFVQNKKISNLIVVDNMKLEVLFSNVSQMDFYSVANETIVDILDKFNTMSSCASSIKSLDSMEFAKIITNSGGLTTFGNLVIPNYTQDTSIAEGIIESLNSNLLCGGFDLKKSKYVGVLICANKSVWSRVPAGSINYGMAMISDLCNPEAVFKGIYEVDDDENVVKIYTIFSGLGLPDSRVEQLKKETQELKSKQKEKNESRNLDLNINTGSDDISSTADKIKQQIAAKKSAFGKLAQGAIIDRRK
jgi:cell division GTPase FtsZ